MRCAVNGSLVSFVLNPTPNKEIIRNECKWVIFVVFELMSPLISIIRLQGQISHVHEIANNHHELMLPFPLNILKITFHLEKC